MNNTTTNPTDTYVADLQPALDFQDKFPTLIQQRRALHNPLTPNEITKVPERLATVDTVENHVGGIIHNAGVKFLDTIHKEIFDAKQPWEKSLIEDQQTQEEIEEDKATLSKLVS